MLCRHCQVFLLAEDTVACKVGAIQLRAQGIKFLPILSSCLLCHWFRSENYPREGIFLLSCYVEGSHGLSCGVEGMLILNYAQPLVLQLYRSQNTVVLINRHAPNNSGSSIRAQTRIVKGRVPTKVLTFRVVDAPHRVIIYT